MPTVLTALCRSWAVWQAGKRMTFARCLWRCELTCTCMLAHCSWSWHRNAYRHGGQSSTWRHSAICWPCRYWALDTNIVHTMKRMELPVPGDTQNNDCRVMPMKLLSKILNLYLFQVVTMGWNGSPINSNQISKWIVLLFLSLLLWYYIHSLWVVQGS